MYGLEDRYRILTPLGRGGEGKVYLAEDLSRGGWVALKVVRGDAFPSPRELRRLCRLRHRALARVYDAGSIEEGGETLCYFTTDYIAGAPIHSAASRLPPDRVEALVAQACDALSYLHGEGWIHGDLTAEHLLCDETGETLRIIDLGHARPLEGGSVQRRGTPAYAAPELWRGARPPGKTTDIYALGMILLQCLAGRLPVSGSRVADWRQWHLTGDRRSAVDQAALPPRFRQIVLECLQIDPADRPPDAESFRARLRAASATTSPPADLIPLIGRGSSLAELRRWMGSGAGTAPVAVVTGPPGVGKTRLLETLGRHALASGRALCKVSGRVTGDAARSQEAWLHRSAGESRRGTLVLVDELTEDLQVGERPFSLWWKEILAAADAPILCAIALPLSSPEEFVRELERCRIPAFLRFLEPLNREQTRALAEEASGEITSQRLSEVWKKSRGVPGRILEEIFDAEPTVTPPEDAAALPPLLGLLDELPAPVPFAVLQRAVSATPEEVWRALGGARTQAPIVSGRMPELRIHPRSAPPHTPVVEPERLLALAAEWERYGDEDGLWASVALRVRAGDATSRAQLTELRQRLRRGGNWPALEWISRLSSDQDEEARWDLLEALLETSRLPEARALLGSNGALAEPRCARHSAVAARIWLRTGHPRKALPHFERAAERSSLTDRRTYSLEGAHVALSLGEREKALSILREMEARGLLRADGFAELGARESQQLAALLSTRGDLERARAVYEHALECARQDRDTDTILAALSGLAGVARARGDLESTIHTLRLGIRFAGLTSRVAQGPRPWLLEANLAAALYRAGRSDEALGIYRSLERSLRREEEQRLLPHVLQGIGTIQRERGELLGAVLTLERASRLADRTENERALAGILANLGELYLLLGHPRAAYDRRLRQLRIARRLGDPSLLAFARAAVGASLIRCGHAPAGRALLDRALGRVGPRPEPWLLAMIWSFRAEAEELAGAEAARSWATACRMARRAGRIAYATRALAGLARAFEPHKPDRALSLLRRGLEWAREESCPPLVRIPLEMLELRLRPAEERRGRLDLSRRALSYGLREEALGSLAWSSGPELADDDSAVEARERLLVSFRRRLDVAGRDALARRLGFASWKELVGRCEAEPPGDPEETLRTHGRLLLRSHGAVSVYGYVTRENEWRPPAFAVRLDEADEETPPPLRILQARAGGGAATFDHGSRSWSIAARILESPPYSLTLLFELGPADPPRTPLIPSPLLEAWAARLFLDLLSRSHREELATLEQRVETVQQEGRDAREEMETRMLSQRLELERESRASEARAVPWVARSASMTRILDQLPGWADSDLNILAYGESGTGKSRILEALHRESSRRDEPFVEENCAALPESLLEAELFGYRAGAFTGAEKDHPGLLERAGGGTLVLDHLEELSRVTQAKLLRALESRRFRPLGGEVEIPFLARLMTTCRTHPREAVRAGRLREDLFYRLQGLEIHLPPLRERTEDILPLFEAFLGFHSARMTRPKPRLVGRASRLLLAHEWPGNAWEISNMVQRWLILGRQRILARDVADLLGAGPRGSDGPFDTNKPWREANADFQRGLLVAVLEECHGNQSRAAERLGLSRRHLINLMEKYEIRVPRE